MAHLSPRKAAAQLSPATKPSSQSYAFIYIALWYVVSFFGVVLNKTTLSRGAQFLGQTIQDIEPKALAFALTASSALWGGLALAVGNWRRGESLKVSTTELPAAKTLLILGTLRCLVVLLGLVSLRHTSASFTETVKASAPFFTVLASYILLRQKTSTAVLLTLIPIVSGLMLASATDLSVTAIGFTAAAMVNVTESVQNVFCKKLLGSDRKGGALSPSELQFYSSLASLAVQGVLFLPTGQLRLPTQGAALLLLALNGFVYFAQSALVFQVMKPLSAVTVSVLNTVKRALIICLTALYFGNVITPLAGLGAACTVAGSFLYSRAVTAEQEEAKEEEDAMTGDGGDAAAASLKALAGPSPQRNGSSPRLCGRGSAMVVRSYWRDRSLPLHGKTKACRRSRAATLLYLGSGCASLIVMRPSLVVETFPPAMAWSTGPNRRPVSVSTQSFAPPFGREGVLIRAPLTAG
eukprot:TRINITY_DN101654_c0_g1_i1.p1 TRINITY_DN101654_c0_g1~~TRINITY_DN101654_c0_g1_i1.p1  ORF type:complete len:466 (+),score=49.01 TRINITY_DN101654_c0_g1_i1:58-1455(+)